MKRTHSRLHGPGVWSLLRPSLPVLALSATIATLAGGGGLVAIWAMVQMVATPDILWAKIAISVWVAAAFMSAGASWLAHVAEASFEARLRRKIAGHLLRLPADRLSGYSTDRLRRLVSDDVAALHHMVAHLPSEVATLAILPLVSAILLVILAGPAALLALVPGALAATVYLTVIPHLSARHGAKRAAVMEQITSAVDEYARGIAIFRLAGSASGALADYAQATKRFTAEMTDWVRKVATPAAVAVGLLQATGSYAVAYTVGYTGDRPRLAAILLLSLALVTPALRLGHGLDYVAAGRAAARRIASFLSEPILPSGHERPDGACDVKVDNLSINIDDHQILKHISFRARAGQITAITGPSGAGKTTLLNAIAGLQPATVGEISIGTTPVQYIDENSRTATALLIPQGADSLAASVRENLVLTAKADDDSLRHALSQVTLPISLDADAAILSGGERQRLGLARALLSRAPVLIFDEPTSALDHDTAEHVWCELTRLAHEEGKTIIVVTHDLELAQRADKYQRIPSVGVSR